MTDYIRIFGQEDGADEAQTRTNNDNDNQPIVLSRKRWFMLSMFIATYVLTNVQWNEYTAISDVIIKYYKISYVAVDWTSLIFVLIYIPLAIPGSYFLQKYGLRNGILVGTGLTCVGSWIKVFSVEHDKFWVVMLGQFVSALAGTFVMQAPPIVASSWFGANEVSTACSLGIFGGLVGIAIGFVLPSIIVPNTENDALFANNLELLLLIIAIIGTMLFMLELIFFTDKPSSPPSHTEMNRTEISDGVKNITKSCLTLLTSRSYLSLVLTFSIIFAVPSAFFVSLNQLICTYYSNASAETGRIGPIIIIAGICGVIINGYLLDKFHYYKSQFLIIQFCSILATVIFTYTLGQPIYVIYFVSVLLGFCWLPALPICIEVILELTYPEPEGLTIGLSYVFGHLVTIFLTDIYSYVIQNVDPFLANYLIIVSLCIGLLCALCIKFNYRRYEVNFS